jgi:hypothetical protein
LLRRTVGWKRQSAGATNTSFAGEIVSQPRRKTPAMVAKIRQRKKILTARNNGVRRGVES